MNATEPVQRPDTVERILIIGAGDVGTNLARDLAGAYEVTVVDIDPDRLDDLESGLSVRTVHGDGRSPETLRAAGLDEADLFVASTDSDEVNVMACGTANELSDVFTIGRVKAVDLYRLWQRADDPFGVDLMLCVDLLTAQRIVRTATLPGVEAVKTFEEGAVELAEFHIEEDDPIAGETVQEADRYPSLTYAGIVRGEDVVVPTGETTIQPGDRLIVIGSRGSITRFSRDRSPTVLVDEGDTVTVVGSGEIGLQTAQLFQDQECSVQLVERDDDRATVVGERFPDLTVVTADATSAEFFETDRFGATDLVVSTADEAVNYLVCRLAKQFTDARTVATVDTQEYVDLFESAGIDIAVQPRTVVAEEVVRIAQGGFTEDVTFVHGDRAEVVEFRVDGESALAGRDIQTAVRNLPDGIVIGAIIRDGQLHNPRGRTIIETGDEVIAFVDADVVQDVTPLL